MLLIRITVIWIIFVIGPIVIGAPGQAEEQEACPSIVEYWRNSIRTESSCNYELRIHDYLVSRTVYEKHWSIEYSIGKMTLRNAFNRNITQQVNWLGSAACYLGTEHLHNGRVRIFHYRGSAGTSRIVSGLAFIDYDMNGAKFTAHNDFILEGECGGIEVDAWPSSTSSKDGGTAKAWLKALGL